jgi:hypothetical protein
MPCRTHDGNGARFAGKNKKNLLFTRGSVKPWQDFFKDHQPSRTPAGQKRYAADNSSGSGVMARFAFPAMLYLWLSINFVHASGCRDIAPQRP